MHVRAVKAFLLLSRLLVSHSGYAVSLGEPEAEELLGAGGARDEYGDGGEGLPQQQQLPNRPNRHRRLGVVLQAYARLLVGGLLPKHTESVWLKVGKVAVRGWCSTAMSQPMATY